MHDRIKILESALSERDKEITYLREKLDSANKRRVQSDALANRNLDEAHQRYFQLATELRQSQAMIKELFQTIDALTRLESI